MDANESDIQIFNSSWNLNLTRYLWSKKLRKPEHLTDMEFICNNGSIQAHSAYLQTLCKVIEEMLKHQVLPSEKGLIVIVPDFTVEIVTKFLEYIYTGKTWITNEDEFEEIEHFGSLLLGFVTPSDWNVVPNTQESSENESISDEEIPLKKKMAKQSTKKSPVKVVTCPGCFLEIPFDDIGEHILAQHSKDGKSSKTTSDSELASKKSTNGESSPKKSSRIMEKIKSMSEVEENNVVEEPRYSFASIYKNLAPASEACVPCTAPGCNKFIHHSNMARHWRCWHPELNKSDYMPNRSRNASVFQNPRRSFDSATSSVEVEPPSKMIRIDASQPVTIRSGFFNPVTSNLANKTLSNEPLNKSTTSSPVVKNSEALESFITIKAEPIEEYFEVVSTEDEGVAGESSTEGVQSEGEVVSFSPITPVTHNLAVKNGNFVCSHSGCDYKSKYNSNMWRHQRKYNHFAEGNTTL